MANARDRLAGYELHEPLGVGGMGIVYRATQLSVDRRVAVKVLSRELAGDPLFRRMFRRESQVASLLEHPNVLPIYEAGESDGLLFIVMPEVDGGTLADAMVRQDLTLVDVLRILDGVAAALDAAHAAGVIHGDVKPTNILLTRTRHPYLADFGAGAVAASRRPDDRFMGSVSYVSPEQLRGDPVGPPADIYSFAALLFECLTGEAVFPAETIPAMMRAHLTASPRLLETADGQRLSRLDDVLARGLAKEPAARFQRATDLIRAAHDALAETKLVGEGRIRARNTGREAFIWDGPPRTFPDPHGLSSERDTQRRPLLRRALARIARQRSARPGSADGQLDAGSATRSFPTFARRPTALLAAAPSPSYELALVVLTPGGERRDVLAEIGRDVTVRMLGRELAAYCGFVAGIDNAHVSVFSLRLQQTLTQDDPVCLTDVRSGDELQLASSAPDGASDRPSEAAKEAVAELVVVSGPLEGHRRRLVAGCYAVGRDPATDIVIDDASISRRHLVVEVSPGSIRVTDAGSINGSVVDGLRLESGQPYEVQPGQIVSIGRTSLTFHPEPTASGVIDFNRPPRVRHGDTAPVILITSDATLGRAMRIPLIPLVVPLLAGGTFWLVSGHWAFLLMSLLSPALMVRAVFSDRIRRATSRRERLDKFKRDVAAAHLWELRSRRAAAPDIVEVVDRATNYRPTLWERRLADGDFLTLRVGLAEQRSRVAPGVVLSPGEKRLRAAARRVADESAAVSDVPVVLDLRSTGLRISGPDEASDGLARWLIVQAATLHSPSDLLIAAAVGPQRFGSWEWLKWLPHTRPEVSMLDGPLLARTLLGQQQLLSSIATLVREDRAEDSDYRPHTTDRQRPHILLLIDDDAPGIEDLRTLDALRERSAVSLSVIWIGSGPRQVHSDIEVLGVVNENGSTLRLRDSQASVYQGEIAMDLLSLDVAATVARSLAGIRDSSPGGSLFSIPTRVSSLSLLGVGNGGSHDVLLRWKSADGAIGGPIGLTPDGVLNIDLRRDGPHALIAGTTGSGKSELLVSLIASMAATRPPTRLNFLLVDYKGGASFRRCERLPHVVELASNLDEHYATRWLISLEAELRRRERVLASANAKDIVEMEAREPDLAPPSLVVVVDEIAALAAELPGFLDGLVDLVQRGRSLGLHLIVATQVPQSVSNKIATATNLRIALRLASASDSDEVISSEAAAWIGRFPGRGYVRTGLSEVVPFQASYTGLAFAGATVRRQRLHLSDLEWDGSSARLETRFADDSAAERTELEVLVSAIEAASRDAYPTPSGPVLPPLATSYSLDDIQDVDWDGDVGPVPFGVEDVPREQLQRPAIFDLANQGSLFILSSQGRVRSESLRAFAASTVRQYSCADVHLYVLDCESRLNDLKQLPNVGAVIGRTETDAATRLLSRLTAEMRRRQEVFAEGGAADIVEHRRDTTAEQRLPHVILLIDSWERFMFTLGERNSGQLQDAVSTLLRDGRAVGIHVVVTGDMTLAHASVASFADDMLILSAPEVADEQGTAGTLHQPFDWSVPGRGFRRPSELELQVAQVGASAVESIGAFARRRDAEVEPSRRPFRLGELSNAADRFHVGDAQGRPVGREDVFAWLRDRDETGASAALLGPRRAGKTWVLAELSRRLGEDGAKAVRPVVIPHPSSKVETPDALARLLDPDVESKSPAQTLISLAKTHAGTPRRRVFLLDEVGRLTAYHPAAVSWLRDLGQAGACLVYTGTEKDWHQVRRWALTAPGSSFGNDVNARILGPLDPETATTFLTGTAANMGVMLSGDTTLAAIFGLVGTWPFYLQVVGDALVRAVQGGDVSALDDEEVLRGLVQERLLDEWTQHFQARWAEIGSAGRSALLEHPGALPTSLSPAQRSDLRDVGLLLPGDLWLPDRPMFDWIARNGLSLRDEEQLA